MDSTSMLKKTYDETLCLMIETRNYLAYKAPSERRRRPGMANLKASREAFRVTSRLTHVMAWLMAQRAAQAGEISLEEACSERHRLARHDVCLDDSSHDDDDMPDGLRGLMDRSLRLYERIARLDDMAGRHADRHRVN